MSKFHKHQVVRHVKTGKVYTIVATPGEAVIEKGWEPCYLYGDRMNPYIARPQEEMEDGRFEVVEVKGGDMWRQAPRRTADNPEELKESRTGDPLLSGMFHVCLDVPADRTALPRLLNPLDPRPGSPVSRRETGESS